MQQENNYVRIDLMKIVEGLIRRFWIIALSMIVAGVLAFSYAAFFITPLYKANVLMYVNNSSFSVGSASFSITSSEISAAKSLVSTYMVILKTRSTLNEVIATGNLDYSYESLVSMIEADSVNNTEVFSITVTCDDPVEAEHIANTIAVVLPDKIADVVEGSSVRIVDYAVVPASKSSPSISKYTMIGLMVGMLVSCLGIAAIEMMDDQVRSEEYLLKAYGDIPLLSTIPDMQENKGSGYYSYNYYQSSSAGTRKSSGAKERKSK